MSKKMHLALNVTNIKKSIEFYQALFQVEPVKSKEGYAKFDLNSPALNFTLNEVKEVTGNSIGHLGIQVYAGEDILKEKKRLEILGLQTMLEEQTNCCYALQDKVWVQDPDGNAWEVFVVLKDSEVMRSEKSECCV